jgi:hypothetical protein
MPFTNIWKMILKKYVKFGRRTKTTSYYAMIVCEVISGETTCMISTRLRETRRTILISIFLVFLMNILKK